jgi:23S rRNA (uracil1939-C5)-methyltransferase
VTSNSGRVKLTGPGATFIVAAEMAKPRRGDVLEVVIDDLAFGGEGVGRVDGYVLFVRGGIPGDRLRVRVTETRARYGRAVIESIETPSAQRVAPPCPYFGRCGGCRLQHIAYPAQLAFKAKQVRRVRPPSGRAGARALRLSQQDGVHGRGDDGVAADRAA